MELSPDLPALGTMDSLPEPSETVEDEWASMKIRFRKEGLDWARLSDQDRILQVLSDLSCFYLISNQTMNVTPIIISREII